MIKNSSTGVISVSIVILLYFNDVKQDSIFIIT